MKTLDVLLEITIYSGILFSGIMLLKLCFKSRMSPFLHFVIWGLLIARLLIPVTLESSVHLFVIPEIQNATAQQAQSPIKSTDATLGTNHADSGAQAQPQANGGQTRAAQTPGVAADKPSALQQAFSPSTEEILLAVWLTGIGIGLLYLTVLYGVLRRRIRANAEPPSKRLLELFEEVKTELHIKRDVRIMCQCEYGTPAILFPNTVLMPIDTLVSMNDEQIKFVLRHELMHFQRGDHVWGLVLSLLSAIYWFNPIVWIAFKKIRSDMETACDSDVVRYYSNDEKSTYAAVILSLFSKKQYGNLVLGMVQGNTKKIAEKRIRGIFMKSQSNKQVKITATLLSLILAITCFTTACQPTPEKAIVAGKDQEYLNDYKNYNTAENKTGKPVENNFSDIPGEWKTSFDIAKGKVYIEAVVEIPSADKYPILKVKPYEIMNDDLDRFYSVFMANKTLYKIPDRTKTKEQLQKLILERQRSISDPNSDFNQIRKSIGEEAYQSSLLQTQEEIKQFQEELKTAPDTVTFEVSDGHFKDKVALGPVPTIFISEDGKTKYTPPEAMGVSEDRMINVQADIEGEYPATLSAYKFESLKMSYIRFENYGGYVPSSGLREGRNSIDGAKVSYEDAEQLAKQTVEQLGFKEFAIDAGGIRGFYNAATENKKDVYTFYFTRVANGIPVTYTNNQFFPMGTEVPKYFELWDPEYIMLHIDDSGILGLSWESPTQMIETVTDNAKLLPFEDIQKIFEKQIKISGAWENNASLIERQVKINRVKLGLCRIAMRDNPDEYIIVPVWDFFGESHEKYPDEEYTENMYRHSYLTINAIDGSIIDRSLGY